MKTAIRKKHHYTLVEIMTVIVIAAILFGIGIPAFTTMIQGSSMTVAIRQLSAKIQAARTYAVTNRCSVAVLLAEAGIRDEYRYSAYRVCVVDSSSKWMNWIEDEDWKTLPKGILRTPLPSSAATITSITSGVEMLAATPPTAIKGLIFNSKGQLTTENIEIKFRQGRYVGSNPVYTERNGSKIVSHPIEVIKYSGKVKVKDLTEEDS